MPWLEVDRMSQKRELVALARADGVDRSELARRYGVARQTLYKWLARDRDGHGLLDRPRRPHRSPCRTPADVEAEVLTLRDRHPAWGPRKLRTLLLRARGLPPDARHPDVPAVSTLAAVLARNGRVARGDDAPGGPPLRFERLAPNDLWQMDFKGHFALSGGGRCHPLGVIDDHSRFALVARACAAESGDEVRPALAAAFERFGLPAAVLADNGAPWGCGGAPWTYTRLEVWLLDQDVRTIHGRPFHPQTQGKEERLHRTMKLEALAGRHFGSHAEVQAALDRWRECYNHERPHEAIGLRVPAARYTPSVRKYVARPAEPEYASGYQTRTPNPVGQVSFRGRTYKLCEAFGGRRVGLRPSATDGVWAVHYRTFEIATLDERDGSCTMC